MVSMSPISLASLVSLEHFPSECLDGMISYLTMNEITPMRCNVFFRSLVDQNIYDRITARFQMTKIYMDLFQNNKFINNPYTNEFIQRYYPVQTVLEQEDRATLKKLYQVYKKLPSSPSQVEEEIVTLLAKFSLNELLASIPEYEIYHVDLRVVKKVVLQKILNDSTRVFSEATDALVQKASAPWQTLYSHLKQVDALNSKFEETIESAEDNEYCVQNKKVEDLIQQITCVSKSEEGDCLIQLFFEQIFFLSAEASRINVEPLINHLLNQNLRKKIMRPVSRLNQM